MENKNTHNSNLMLAIYIVGAAICASLIFLAIQLGGKMSDEDLQTAIFQGIDNYIAKQQEEANKPKTWTVEDDFTDDDPFLGDTNAPVTIVEWSDYECYYCGRFHLETFAQIKSKYIDTGKVKFVYRDLPLPDLHQNAYSASLLAECVNEQVENDVYFEMHDKIIKTIANTGYNYDTFVAYAEELDVDIAELKSCFDSNKYKDEIDADAADAAKAGFRGTPGFVINGLAFSGALPYKYFEENIEAALAKK